MLIPAASLWQFGVLQSLMHMAWTSQVCGRLKSDYRYSIAIVYNNFPWPGPKPVPEPVRAQVEAAAQRVLDTRARYPSSSLADLYDPLAMPADLLEAHRALDGAVDAAYLQTLPDGFPSSTIGRSTGRSISGSA